MAERKTKMQAQYDHLWISGDPGIVVGMMALPDNKDIDKLKTHLFYYNIVAEMWTEKSSQSGLYKYNVESHKMIKSDGEHRIMFVTTEPRVEQLKATAAEILGVTDFDLVLTTPKTGNRYYIDWVKDQTVMPGSAEEPLPDFIDVQITH